MCWKLSDASSRKVLKKNSLYSGAQRAELEAIASEPASKHVFKVSNYAALDELRFKLAWRACQCKCPPRISYIFEKDMLMVIYYEKEM